MKETKSAFTIHVVESIQLLWRDRKKVSLYTFAGIIVGLVVSFSIPSTYKTSVILAPEVNSKGLSGNITSLAAMVGMNLNMNTSGDAIYPAIYPSVISSTDFIVSLFTVPVTTKDGSYQADYATYLKSHTRTAWWNYPMKWLSKGIGALSGKSAASDGKKELDPFRLTRSQWATAKAISRAITCQVDKKTNVITLTFKDQDPLISACMADTVQQRLQTLVINYRTHKARMDAQYLEQILAEALSNYEQAQNIYASYVSAHKNTNTEFVIQEAKRLKSNMDLQSQIYTNVAQQLQLAKAKVQECTPAFTTLQRASVPVRRSNMSRFMVIVIWMFLGFFVRCGVLVWKNKEMFYA